MTPKLVVGVIVLAVILDVYIVWVLGRYRRLRRIFIDHSQRKVLGIAMNPWDETLRETSPTEESNAHEKDMEQDSTDTQINENAVRSNKKSEIRVFEFLKNQLSFRRRKLSHGEQGPKVEHLQALPAGEKVAETIMAMEEGIIHLKTLLATAEDELAKLKGALVNPEIAEIFQVEQTSTELALPPDEPQPAPFEVSPSPDPAQSVLKETAPPSVEKVIAHVDTSISEPATGFFARLKKSWYWIVIGLTFVEWGNWMLTHPDIFKIFPDAAQRFEKFFVLGIPHFGAVMFGFLLLLLGGGLFAWATSSLVLGNNQPMLTTSPSGFRLKQTSKALWILIGAVCLLTLFVLWRMKQDVYSNALVWMWGISLVLPVVVLVWWDCQRKSFPKINISWKEVGGLAVLIIAGLWIGGFQLDMIPDILMGDEGNFWETSRAIAIGEYKPNFFGLGTYSFPMISLIYQSIFPRIFGLTLWSWRVSSLVAGVLTIVPLYLLLRDLFSARVGWMASIMMLISPYFLAFSRMGYNNSQALFPVVLGLLLWWQGIRQRSWTLLYLAGIVTGFGFYTYTAARLGAVVAGLFLGYLWIRKDVKFKKALIFGGIFMVGLLLTIAPNTIYGLVHSPNTYWYKFGESAFFNAFYGRAMFGEDAIGDVLASGNHELFYDLGMYGKLITRGVIRTFLAFNYDNLIAQHFIVTPLSGGVLVGLLYVLGLGFSLVRWRDQRYMLLVIWFFSGLILLSMVNTFPPRHQHLIPVIPVVATFAALGIEALARLFEKVWPTKWSQNGLILLLVGIVVVYGVRDYYKKMPENYLPDMENVLFFTYTQVAEPSDLVYIRAEDTRDDFIPWGIRYFDHPMEFSNVSLAEFLQNSDQYQRRPAIFYCAPPECSDVLPVLEENYPDGITKEYLNREGRFVAVAFATKGLKPWHYETGTNWLEWRMVALSLAIAFLWVGLIWVLKKGTDLPGLANRILTALPDETTLPKSRPAVDSPLAVETDSNEKTISEKTSRYSKIVEKGLVSLGVLSAVLIGQHNLIQKRDLSTGLLALGVGLLLFLWFAWKESPAPRPASSQASDVPPQLWMTDQVRQIVVGISLFLALSTVRSLAILGESESRWGVFGVWLLSMGLYLVAFSPRPRRKKFHITKSGQMFWLALGLIALIALLVRFLSLGAVPVVMENDEGIVAIKSMEVIAGQLKDMFQIYRGNGTMHFFLMSIPIRIIGQTKFAVRLVSALMGVITVPVVAAFANHLFGKRVAWLSAGLLAVSHFHIHFSRISPAPSTFDPLFVTLSIFLVYRALETRKKYLWALAGLVMSIVLYFYVGARVIPIIVIVFLCGVWVVDRSLLKGNYRHIIIMFGAYLVAAAPMFYAAISDPGGFNNRLNTVGIIQSGWLEYEIVNRGLPVWRILLDQLWNSLLIFNYHPARWFYEANIPMLGLLTGGLFFVGLFYALTRWRDVRFIMLNVWFWVSLGTGQVLMVDPPPNAYRTMVVLPAAILMGAVVFVRLVEAFSAILRNKLRRAQVEWMFLILALLFAAGWNFWQYFGIWAPGYQYSDIHTRTASLIGDYLGDLPDGYQGYVVTNPHFRGVGWSSLEFLRDTTPFQDVEFVELESTVKATKGSFTVIFPAAISDDVDLPNGLTDYTRRVEKYLGDTLYIVAYEFSAEPGPDD